MLPSGATKQLESAYRRGRTKLFRMRYGNPGAQARIIAVVGKSGKTTTAQLIMGLLLESGHSVAVFDPNAHGNSVGSLWRGLAAGNQQKAEFIIIEVSPELLRSDALKALVLDTVVVTNDCDEAAPLLQHQTEYAVIPEGHQFGALTIAEHQIVSFGTSNHADAKIEKAKLFRKGTEINFILDHHTPVDVATHLVGSANVSNVAAAVSAAYVLGVPLDTVAEGIARCEAIPGNFEYLESDGPFITVVDKAPDETSAELIIQSAKELAKRRLVVAIAIEDVKAGFITRMQQHVDRLVVVGKQNLPSSVETVDTAEEARAIAERAAKKDDTVLLLGESFIIENS